MLDGVRARALFRIFLGSAQVTGATTTLVLFLQTGDSNLTLGIAAVTFTLTALSLFLSRKEK
jgi:hypothetical protein